MFRPRPARAFVALLLFTPLAQPTRAELIFGDPPCADSGHCHLTRWESQNDTDESHVGRSTAIFGTTAAVGVPGDDEVRIYEQVDGVWSLHQTLDSPGLLASEFGTAVAMHAEWLVVGAPSDQYSGVQSGRAFFYQWQGDQFTLRNSIGPTTPGPNSRFGAEVAIGANWAAVGQPEYAPGGRVVTFERVGNFWVDRHDLHIPGSHSFGTALAIWENELVAGDWSNALNGPESGVALYYELFNGPINGVRIVQPETPQVEARFGYSVALDAERLIVGAVREDNVELDDGAAYVFERVAIAGSPPHTYTQVQRLTPCHSDVHAKFGYRVAIDNGRALVSSPREGDKSGRVYTFRRGGIVVETWTIEDQIGAEDGEPADQFGNAVALHGDLALIGSPGVSDPGQSSLGGYERGAAYLVSFTRTTGGGGACPCDVIAGTSFVGTGKPGPMGVPELTLNRLVVPEENVLAILKNVPVGAVPIIAWGAEPGAIPLDGGTLHMLDPHLAPMPVVGAFGQVGLQFALNPSPAICGVDLIMQAFVIEPEVMGDSFISQSAALRARIGY